MWDPDVGQASDEGLTESGQLHKESLVPLLDQLILFLHALQVLLHGRNLEKAQTLAK